MNYFSNDKRLLHVSNFIRRELESLTDKFGYNDFD